MIIDMNRNGEVAQHNKNMVEYFKHQHRQIDITHLTSDPVPLTPDLLMNMFSYSNNPLVTTPTHSILISNDEASGLILQLTNNLFLWPSNKLLVKDPTDPIYIESFKKVNCCSLFNVFCMSLLLLFFWYYIRF